MIKKVKRHTWIKNDVDRDDLNLIYSKLDEIIDYLNGFHCEQKIVPYIPNYEEHQDNE